jgi:hypothetical protein
MTCNSQNSWETVEPIPSQFQLSQPLDYGDEEICSTTDGSAMTEEELEHTQVISQQSSSTSPSTTTPARTNSATNITASRKDPTLPERNLPLWPAWLTDDKARLLILHFANRYRLEYKLFWKRISEALYKEVGWILSKSNLKKERVSSARNRIAINSNGQKQTDIFQAIFFFLFYFFFLSLYQSLLRSI